MKATFKFFISFCIVLLSLANVFTTKGQAKDFSHLIGKEVSQYTFIDTAGNEFTLAALKGKYIYLDIWASWCRPCINEFPYLDSLKEKFSDKNIAFVQISCDAQKWRWMNGIGWYKRTGLQFKTSGQDQFMKDFSVSSIPRYILIDRQGKIINPNMNRASDPETIHLIEKLKGI